MSVTTPSSLAGFYKDAYADDVGLAHVDDAKALQATKFIASSKLGNEFVQPIEVGGAHSLTFLDENGDSTTLQDSISSKTVKAALKGAPQIERVALSAVAASRARSSKDAFGDAVGTVIENGVRFFKQKLEHQFFYGRSAYGLGAIVSQSGSGTSRTFVMDPDTMAMGPWLAAKDLQLDCVNTSGTIQNPDAVIVVTKVDLVNSTVYVTGDATDLDACGATDTFILYGSSGKGLNGLMYLASPGSTLWGVTVADYPSEMKAQTLAVDGPLTLQAVLEASAMSLQVGSGTKQVIHVNPKTFAKLAADESMLVSHAGGGLKKNGASGLSYENGDADIMVVSNKFVAPEHAFLWCPDELTRRGSSDVTDRNLFNQDERGVFIESPTKSEAEFRLFADFQLASARPAGIVVLTGITN